VAASLHPLDRYVGCLRFSPDPGLCLGQLDFGPRWVPHCGGHELGFVSKLRRVPTERIVLAEFAETQRQLEAKLASPGLTDAGSAYIASAYHRLQATAQQWTQRKTEQLEVTCKMIAELRNEIRAAGSALRLRGVREHQPA
jgi:hypothetical protein